MDIKEVVISEGLKERYGFLKEVKDVVKFRPLPGDEGKVVIVIEDGVVYVKELLFD